jgi:hypothetical protein
LTRPPGGAGLYAPLLYRAKCLVPTLLGRLNLKAPPRVTGQDLWPYAAGRRSNNRDHIVPGFGWIASVRTPEWNYIAVWNPEKYPGSFAPQLYNSRKDPQELKNVIDSYPHVANDLDARLRAYIDGGWEITKGSFAGRV